MLSCDEAARSILRSLDLDEPPGQDLEAHLAVCAACRSALEDQRVVSQILRARPADRVSPAFTSRLEERLDETMGWFGIADWRAWTIRLSPAIAALALAAFLTSDSATAAPGLAEWTMSGPEAASDAALLWESDVTPESVVETMLGQSEASGGAGADER